MNEVEEPLWAEVRGRGKGCRGQQRLTVPKTKNSQVVLVTACVEVLGQEPATPHVWREVRAGCDRLVTVSRLFSSLAIPFPSSRTHGLLYLIGRFHSSTTFIHDFCCRIEFMHQLIYNDVINSHWLYVASREHHEYQ